MMLLLAMSPPPLSRFFFFSCSPLSWWRQIGEPKTWQDCNVSERFALGCRSAPLTSTQQWRQRRLQFSTTVWGRLIMSEILHFVYKPIQVCKLAWKLITGWCCLGLRFPSQIYFTERARAPARSQPCYETLQICEDDENHMNAAADAQHTVSGSAGLF